MEIDCGLYMHGWKLNSDPCLSSVNGLMCSVSVSSMYYNQAACVKTIVLAP